MKRTLFIALSVILVSTFAQARPNFRERIKELRQNDARENINRPNRGNEEVVTINVNGQDRSFIIENQQQDRNAPKPLVIMLHGGGGSAKNAKMMTGFSQLARQKGFIIAYPNGYGKTANAMLTWNATHCCGPAMRDKSNDIEFISALIDKAISEYGADKRRIYVTGMSNGAMMTHQLAIALPHKIAAIGTDVGTMFGDEKLPASPVPAIIINGMKDEMLPFEGGDIGGHDRAWDGTKMQPANYQAQFWAKANHCQPNPKTFENAILIENTYICPENAQVKQIVLKEGTHAWYGGKSGRPDKPEPSKAIDSSEEIWNFVSKFRK